ncbi:MAG: hypothetical protein AAGU74_13625 [Bacillota bacterium]
MPPQRDARPNVTRLARHTLPAGRFDTGGYRAVLSRFGNGPV